MASAQYRYRHSFFKTPVLGRMALILYRASIAWRAWGPRLKCTVKWLLKSREITNFTYDLHPLNRRYLAVFTANILNRPCDDVLMFFAELENDQNLAEHVRKVTASTPSGFISDSEPQFARRLAWYALARALKPKVIVETGVDKGLGACLLTSALMRNADEGNTGHYYGLDIDPEAGFLLCGQYAEYGELIIGDALASLGRFEDTIDLFINASDHHFDYEAEEYETIAPKLTPDAVIIGDNAHLSDALLRFARESGRHFQFFKEVPLKHWYSGAGIGVAFYPRG